MKGVRGDEDLLTPTAVRQATIARDGGSCRLCGAFQGPRGCRHHIIYRSQGGLDVVENLVTLGWLPGSCCCHQRAHSEPVWRDLLLEVVKPENQGATALQLRRWRR
ncbi:MAG: HNH endonuclease [Oryzihumus sp.]